MSYDNHVGVSFVNARDILVNAVESALSSNHQCQHVPETSDRLFMVWMPLASSILLAIAAALDDTFLAGRVFSLVLLSVSVILNLYVTKRYNETESEELRNQLSDIISQYTASIAAHSNVEHEQMKTPKMINSGHAHVSIVAVYRDGHWQRIPTLLLVEGDIIALMAGDITPGELEELISDRDHHTMPVSPRDMHTHGQNSFMRSFSTPAENVMAAPLSTYSMKRGWKLGKRLHKGIKIPIREERRKYASYDPKRDDNSRDVVAPSVSGNTGLNHDRERSGSYCSERGGDDHHDHSESKHSEKSQRQRSGSFNGSVHQCANRPLKDIPTSDTKNLRGGIEHTRSNPQVHTYSHGDRHKHSRAINSQSVELLTLSRDMRCFIMRETPIVDYCLKALESNRPTRKSYLRSLFLEIYKESWKLLWVVCALVIMSAAVRLALISEARAQSTHIATIVIVPLAVVLLSFFPVSMPVTMLLIEAVTTANVLATTEALINGVDDGDDDSSAPSSSSKSSKRNGFQSSGTPTNLKNTYNRRVADPPTKQVKNSHRNSPGDDDSSSESSTERDEFLDEDIDDRAVKIADQASYNIPWGRQMLYTLKVLGTRLQLRLLEGCKLDGYPWSMTYTSDSDSQSSPPTSLLPIPLARTRLIEVLGAVTMVCFIDDDIVCEGFSVSEEVFLLKNRELPVAPIDNTPGVQHGIVLDLHANPQATGSRFENPRWWTHLSSLKPIGLNSMLTYAPCFVEKSKSYFRNQDSVYADELPRPDMSRSVTTSTIIAPPDRHRVESSLVDHVKRSIPLECLRELAEEIGFVEADIENFKRLLELSVVAPRLGDIRLMEDTHAWGQEETRRRGNLDPHVNAVVAEDSRKGGLQLMSHGYPPLLLSYCREYWDGANISPLTSEDRNQILGVYERWDLEDFDVVALAYSPVPITLHEQISSHNSRKNMQSSEARDNNDSVHSGEGRQTSGCTLFFVDSCTERQLHNYRKRVAVMSAKEDRSPEQQKTDGSNDSPEKSSPGAEISSTGIEERRLSSGSASSSEMRRVDSSEQSNIQAQGQSEELELNRGQSILELSTQRVDSLSEGTTYPPLTTPSPLRPVSLICPPRLDCIEHMHLIEDVAEVRQTCVSAGYESTLSAQYNILPEERTSADFILCEVQSEPTRSPPHRPDSADDKTGMPITTAASMVNMRDLHSVTEEVELPLKVAESSRATSSEMEMDFGTFAVPPQSWAMTGVDTTKRRRHVRSSSDQLNVRKKSSNNTVLGLMYSNIAASVYASQGYSPTLSTDGSIFLSEDSPGTASPPAVYFPPDISPRTNIPRERIRPADSFDINGYNLISDDSVADDTTFPSRRNSDEIRRNSLDTIDTELSDHDNRLLSSKIDGDSYEKSKDRAKFKKSFSLDHGLHGLNVKKSKSSTDMNTLMESSVGTEKVKPNTSDVLPPVYKAISEPSVARTQSVPAKAFTASMKRASQPSPAKSHKPSSTTAPKGLSEAVWSILRQQVFLGMTASSVPVRHVMPEFVEDLTEAGVRFVYFSPRNMRRSKKVAEKIGLQTDWNCAISLRPLDSPDTHDPHRFISSYADWDVMAKLPHGIDAIKKHLREIDNVPLLVSLFTDATPSTIQSMVGIFREHGEVVMSIGSAYRSYNQAIYSVSDLGIAVDMLPGEHKDLLSSSDHIVSAFPVFSSSSLCQADLTLMFRLVSLNTSTLLQSPPSRESQSDTATSPRINSDENVVCPEVFNISSGTAFEGLVENMEEGGTSRQKAFVPSLDILSCTGCFGISGHQRDGSTATYAMKCTSDELKEMDLRGLLEAIRKGRVFLLNAKQVLALLCISCLSLALWGVYSQAIPLSIPPIPPPPMALLFLCVQLPCISLAMFFSPAVGDDHVMRKTPRKNNLIRKPRDISRFQNYLSARLSTVCISVFVVGWIATSSKSELDVGRNESGELSSSHWTERMATYRDILSNGNLDSDGRAHFLFVQDMMSCQFLLSIVAQSATLLHRGQSIWQLPSPISHPEYYVMVIVCLALQGGVVYLRALGRRGGVEQFLEADWQLWVAMTALPVLGLVIGFVVNWYDNFNYRRYLKFLRLEFDTRLGMFSPR